MSRVLKQEIPPRRYQGHGVYAQTVCDERILSEPDLSAGELPLGQHQGFAGRYLSVGNSINRDSAFPCSFGPLQHRFPLVRKRGRLRFF
jgi:hypothetical protein